MIYLQTDTLAKVAVVVGPFVRVSRGTIGKRLEGLEHHRKLAHDGVQYLQRRALHESIGALEAMAEEGPCQPRVADVVNDGRGCRGLTIFFF